ncbi:MAG: PEP-CTERM sorting domain-containing protein [Sterolibacteriaceae bacterium]|nr:PEP-CTERM sorting domain-containing protein [Candidatus Methylophosphatis haderslevensis]
MTSSRRRRAAGLCALIGALVAGPATAAQVLDFNLSRFQVNGVTTVSGESPLILEGYSFAAVGSPGLDFFAIDDLTGKVGDGTPRLVAFNNATVVLGNATGKPFDLLSLDFGGSWTNPDDRFRWADKIEINGYRGNSAVGHAFLDLDPNVPILSTASLGAQFRGVSSVSFHGLGDIGTGGNNHEFALDNLVVSHVPEPETYALMLAGLGLLAWRGRSGAKGKRAG